MGHYRSEMGFEAQDAREAQEKEERRKQMAEAIKEAIKQEGLEFVLADILLDPMMARIRLRK